MQCGCRDLQHIAEVPKDMCTVCLNPATPGYRTIFNINARPNYVRDLHATVEAPTGKIDMSVSFNITKRGPRQLHPIFERFLLELVDATHLLPYRLISVGGHLDASYSAGVSRASDESGTSDMWLPRQAMPNPMGTEAAVKALPEKEQARIRLQRPTYRVYSCDGVRRLQLPAYDRDDCDFDPLARMLSLVEHRRLDGPSAKADKRSRSDAENVAARLAAGRVQVSLLDTARRRYRISSAAIGLDENASGLVNNEFASMSVEEARLLQAMLHRVPRDLWIEHELYAPVFYSSRYRNSDNRLPAVHSNDPVYTTRCQRHSDNIRKDCRRFLRTCVNTTSHTINVEKFLDENSSEQNNSASPAVAAVKQTQHKTPQQRAMITSKKHRIQQAHKFNKTSCHALGHHIRMTHGYDSYITATYFLNCDEEPFHPDPYEEFSELSYYTKLPKLPPTTVPDLVPISQKRLPIYNWPDENDQDLPCFIYKWCLTIKMFKANNSSRCIVFDPYIGNYTYIINSLCIDFDLVSFIYKNNNNGVVVAWKRGNLPLPRTIENIANLELWNIPSAQENIIEHRAMTNGSMNKLIESDLPINPSQKISHEKRLIAIDIAQHFALNQEEALKYLQHEIVYNTFSLLKVEDSRRHLRDIHQTHNEMGINFEDYPPIQAMTYTMYEQPAVRFDLDPRRTPDLILNNKRILQQLQRPSESNGTSSRSIASLAAVAANNIADTVLAAEQGNSDDADRREDGVAEADEVAPVDSGYPAGGEIDFGLPFDTPLNLEGDRADLFVQQLQANIMRAVEAMGDKMWLPPVTFAKEHDIVEKELREADAEEDKEFLHGVRSRREKVLAKKKKQKKKRSNRK